MLASDYIVCARGGDNFSMRLYETLCCGRIPVFVNTDCVLPFEEQIDWRRYCVWIEEYEIDSIANRVWDFHKSLSEAGFQDLQKRCRKLWEEWLSPLGFYRKLQMSLKRVVAAHA